MAAFCLASGLAGTPESAAAAEKSGTGEHRHGHPKITLDELDLSRAPAAQPREKTFRDALAKEARKIDWGAGREARIVYRLRIDQLEVTEENGVLRLRCSATGWLPRGKVAKSRLSFGGSPKDRDDLVDHVLRIVARGVLTRLGEMERERREG